MVFTIVPLPASLWDVLGKNAGSVGTAHAVNHTCVANPLGLMDALRVAPIDVMPVALRVIIVGIEPEAEGGVAKETQAPFFSPRLLAATAAYL